jgi:hypothetical protein
MARGVPTGAKLFVEGFSPLSHLARQSGSRTAKVSSVAVML